MKTKTIFMFVLGITLVACTVVWSQPFNGGVGGPGMHRPNVGEKMLMMLDLDDAQKAQAAKIVARYRILERDLTADNKVVGIYVPGRRSHSQPAEKGTNGNHPPKPPELSMPATIEMTYSETTGPLKMDVEDVRRTGIGIGVGQPEGSRYVFEFIVPFAADEMLSEMGSGKVIGVGIMSGKGETEKRRQKPSMGAMGGPEGGGGRGRTGKGPGMGGGFGGGGKSGSEKRSDPYEVWLKVQLT